MNPIKLPSGAELKITLAPFEDARELYDAVLEEAKALTIDPLSEIDANLYKDLFCMAFSSKKIRRCIEKCAERATYNGLKITNETWEPLSARDDYMKVQFEIAKENVFPFVKSLYAEYGDALKAILSDPASRPRTT